MRTALLFFLIASLITGCLGRFEKPPQVDLSVQRVLRLTESVQHVYTTANLIYLQSEKSVLGFAAGWQLKWRYRSPVEINLVALLGKYLFISRQDKKIVLLDRYNGKTVFQAQLAEWIALPPLQVKDRVYLMGSLGGLYNIKKGTQAVRLLAKFSARFSAPAASHKGKLFFATFEKKLYCFEPLTQKVEWQISLPSAADTKPCFDGRFIYLSCRYFHIVKIDQNSSKIVLQVKEESWVNRLAQWGEFIYYRTHSFSLVCRAKSDFKEQWRFRGTEKLRLPLRSGRSLFVSGMGKKIYQLWMGNGLPQGILYLNRAISSPVFVFQGEKYLIAGRALYRLLVTTRSYADDLK